MIHSVLRILGSYLSLLLSLALRHLMRVLLRLYKELPSMKSVLLVLPL
jgi:hypothetical protein